ncbi:MAG: XRE family transcriptional regulator [Anaerolineaceae bacterium]|jgi:transcriptional regulator with XRE-family HTH domain
MLPELVKYKLGQDHLTLREASQAAGVSHTTLARVVNGVPVDIETLVSVCNWLGVKPADALNSEMIGDSDEKLVASLTILVEREPALASIFREALKDLEKGNLSPQDVQEIMSYAAYRITQGKARLST